MTSNRFILDSDEGIEIVSQSNKDKQLVGAAGEHLVLSRLLARGLLASQAPRGTRKADILVNPLDGGRPVLIQVKTRSDVRSRVSWPMNIKHETVVDKDLFYCFVDLGLEDSSVYVVPAKKVANIIKEDHAKWLKAPGSKGQKHNDSQLRKIQYAPTQELKEAPRGWMDKYLEAWELLN